MRGPRMARQSGAAHRERRARDGLRRDRRPGKTVGLRRAGPRRDSRRRDARRAVPRHFRTAPRGGRSAGSWAGRRGCRCARRRRAVSSGSRADGSDVSAGGGPSGARIHGRTEREGDMDLRGQVAVVTGSSRGIGRAIALRCAAAGARLVLTARDEEGLRATAERIGEQGGSARVLPADLTDGQQVERMIEEVDRNASQIDLLVNNAGRLTAIGPSWLVDPRDWMRDISDNISMTYLCTWAVVPRMIARKEGRIVNLVGGGTRGPFPYAAAYGCSKAAIMGFTESLAEELEGTGVRAFALRPGLVRTRMTEQFLDTEAGRKWMSRLGDRLQRGEDVPPRRAAELVVALATGRYDAASGRLLDATAEAPEGTIVN
ncbi:MAG: SDR family NAD(P)-dependent oxidoreductase [Candidatus Eisenbacteria bacterium]|nr:SDR family NAD(P)-dependent oxidoreductase [Candidatus Eisenbacteria bacterium]